MFDTVNPCHSSKIALTAVAVFLVSLAISVVPVLCPTVHSVKAVIIAVSVGVVKNGVYGLARLAVEHR